MISNMQARIAESTSSGNNTSSTMKDFEIVKVIGEGSFAKVYKVTRKSDGKCYAMKKCRIGSMKMKDKENALNEVRILASISSPYIVGYKEAIFEESSECLYVIMEYAAGGDLMQQVKSCQANRKSLDERIIWTWTIQMILGLQDLHRLRILHRDLKCANVFLDGNFNAKIGDLNVSKITQANLAKTQVGTPYYTSPEVWKDQIYNDKSDIWSLGCLIYELCALKPPFQAHDMPSLFQKINKGTYERIPQRYSHDLSLLISQCLQVNQQTRFDCTQLLSLPSLRNKAQELNISLTPAQTQVASQSPSSNSESIQQNNLLGVIKFPLNKQQSLQERLPKPSYNSVSQQEIKRIVSPTAEQVVVQLPPSAITYQVSEQPKIIRRVRSISGIPLQRNAPQCQYVPRQQQQPSQQQQQQHYQAPNSAFNVMLDQEIKRRLSQLHANNANSAQERTINMLGSQSRKRIISEDIYSKQQYHQQQQLLTKPVPGGNTKRIERYSAYHQNENIPILSNRPPSQFGRQQQQQQYSQQQEAQKIRINVYPQQERLQRKRDIPLPPGVQAAYVMQQRCVTEAYKHYR